MRTVYLGHQIRIYPLRNVTTPDDTTNRFFHSLTNIDVVAGETYTYSAWYKRINNNVKILTINNENDIKDLNI